MSRAEDLFTRMHYTNELTNKEILELDREIEEFFQSDEPEEDKQELRGYTESFVMICNAIREGKLDGRIPSKPTIPKKKYTFEPFEVPEFLKRKIKENTKNDI